MNKIMQEIYKYLDELKNLKTKKIDGGREIEGEREGGREKQGGRVREKWRELINEIKKCKCKGKFKGAINI